jgi:hypothetical protein
MTAGTTQPQKRGERVLKGTLLKFADWRWSKGKEALEVKEATRLVALGTAAAWVRWSGGKPAEYRVREVGRRLPDREELGDQDEADWEAGPSGEPRDPWQSTRFVYLVDPMTAEAFTFSTSTWGGRGAVADLGDQIQRMRYANPGAVPVVELHAAPMLTKFGRKSKPWFKVVDWKMTGAAPGATPQIESKNTITETSKVMDDEIPF